MIWQPEESCIVMGSSNRAETAIHEECARADGWPVYKRPSGGQSVILTSSTLVISIRFFSGTQENPRTYFRRINRLIISALEGLGITGLSEKGISDIALRDKKILGSSIYRKKTLVFYHAVLNVAESPERISRYLKHPSREPDYRAGRKHEEFVTSLRMSGYNQEMDEIRKALSGSLAGNL